MLAYLENIVFIAAAAAGMWLVFNNVRQKIDQEKTDADEPP